MSQQPSKTIVCPQCGNINMYDAENCLKCGLALAPIREAMVKAGASGNVETPPVPAKAKEPVPPLPQLTQRPTEEKIGNFVDSWRFLIRGMGDRSQEIAARFFNQLAERGIEGLKLSTGKLIIELDGGKRDSRHYYFAERDLGQSALATMAIRIAPVGTDLFIEWRHYALPSKDPSGMVFGLGALGLAGFLFLILLSELARGGGLAGIQICFCSSMVMGIIGAFLTIQASTNRRSSLIGFQYQDSTAFQLAVRAALEEAIDLAGISKALIQELPTEKSKERRVI